jgi:hypothetical protein
MDNPCVIIEMLKPILENFVRILKDIVLEEKNKTIEKTEVIVILVKI